MARLQRPVHKLVQPPFVKGAPRRALAQERVSEELVETRNAGQARCPEEQGPRRGLQLDWPFDGHPPVVVPELEFDRALSAEPARQTLPIRRPDRILEHTIHELFWKIATLVKSCEYVCDGV